jgi:hypothetical protein
MIYKSIGSVGGWSVMKILLSGVLLAVLMSTVSVAKSNYRDDDRRRNKAVEKQKRKSEKRQKEIISRTVKSHEILIFRREKLRVPKKVQEHVMEYKKKSKKEDKKSHRKAKRAYKKLDHENDHIVKANKSNYSTEYSKKRFETINAPDDKSKDTFKVRKHVKKNNRGNTTFNDPEDVVRQMR